MNIIDTIRYSKTDPRCIRYLFPKAVSLTKGNVSDPENLLKELPLQIGLSESMLCELKNDGGENAAVVLDYGVELCGGLRLLTGFITGEKYPLVRLTFGESLSEAMSSVGEKNATNEHSIRDFTVPLSFLSDMQFGNTGFRFVKIELLTQNCTLRIKSAVAAFVFRDVKQLGSFECSDSLVNRIYDTAVYTCLLNMQNLLWDGIKRDRLVWIGDMHPEMLTIRSVFGADPIIPESMDFVMDQTPLPGWMNGMPSYSMWWTVLLWDWYVYTGDKEFLCARKDYALALIRQLAAIVAPDGSDNLPSYFLDWPTNNTPAAVCGSRALLRMALKAGAELATFFGDLELVRSCSASRRALNNRTDDHCGYSQAAAFMALSGASDPVEINREVLSPKGGHGMSTFMAYYILKAMSLAGNTVGAVKALKQYYGGMLDMGATTFWEDFDLKWMENACPIDRLPKNGESDVHGDNGAFCYVGFRHSLCHGWSSGVAPFLTERVLGVDILTPGCKSICLRPDLGGLEWARGSFPTPMGVLEVECEKGSDGRVLTKLNAPDGVNVERFN